MTKLTVRGIAFRVKLGYTIPNVSILSLSCDRICDSVNEHFFPIYREMEIN